jgi:hypothetical protein
MTTGKLRNHAQTYIYIYSHIRIVFITLTQMLLAALSAATVVCMDVDLLGTETLSSNHNSQCYLIDQ